MESVIARPPPDLRRHRSHDTPHALDFATRRINGFTIIEVMIVVVIVGILSAVAMPAYVEHIVRGRIPDATSNLAAKQIKMEQWFQDNRSYLAVGSTSNCGIGATDTTASVYFTFTCTASSAEQYIVTATGTGAMQGFVYTINQNGAKATTGVPANWVASASCWVTKKGGTC